MFSLLASCFVASRFVAFEAMAGLPLIKLSALLVKTISKPVAAFMKAQAQKEKRLAEFFCLIGQSMHYVQSRINVIASGYKFVGVKPLPGDQALNDGVGTFSEILVLSISATLVIYEYDRGVKKDIVKNDKLSAEKAHQRYLTEARFQGIENRLHRIEQLLEQQAQQAEGGRKGGGQEESRTRFGLGALLLGRVTSTAAAATGAGAVAAGEGRGRGGGGGGGGEGAAAAVGGGVAPLLGSKGKNESVDQEASRPDKAFSTPENA